jgi:hypothetical protein
VPNSSLIPTPQRNHTHPGKLCRFLKRHSFGNQTPGNLYFTFFSIRQAEQRAGFTLPSLVEYT